MAKYYRCYRCNPPAGCEFADNGGKCPKCAATQPAVVELTLVHFLYEHADGGATMTGGVRYHIACMPGKPLANHPGRPMPASDQPMAVTCPACVASAAYQAAAEQWGWTGGGLKIGEGCCG